MSIPALLLALSVSLAAVPAYAQVAAVTPAPSPRSAAESAAFTASLAAADRVDDGAPYPALPATPLAERVLIVSIDGLRPDLAKRADMPNLRKLMDRGSYTLWAYTTPAAVTMPSHTSMLTGVTIGRHGITFNGNEATTRKIYPNVPTIFEVASKAGKTTAMAVEKVKFVVLDKPRTIDTLVMGDATAAGGKNWVEYVDTVGALVRGNCPDVMFFHIGRTDLTGHAKGWGSPEHIAMLGEADAALGKVFAAYDDAGLTDTTAIIVSADHGGKGRSHGRNDPMSRFIPWICAGPGVRKGVDLTSEVPPTDVYTYDTFATALYLIGVEAPAGIDGRPVTRILESSVPSAGQELMAAPVVAAPTTKPSDAAAPSLPPGTATIHRGGPAVEAYKRQDSPATPLQDAASKDSQD